MQRLSRAIIAGQASRASARHLFYLAEYARRQFVNVVTGDNTWVHDFEPVM